jgi:hypothetical protein
MKITTEQKQAMYMNLETGSVDTYDGWEYLLETGEIVNGVDRNEAVKVKRGPDGDWVETD